MSVKVNLISLPGWARQYHNSINKNLCIQDDFELWVYHPVWLNALVVRVTQTKNCRICDWIRCNVRVLFIVGKIRVCIHLNHFLNKSQSFYQHNLRRFWKNFKILSLTSTAAQPPASISNCLIANIVYCDDLIIAYCNRILRKHI